MMRRTPLKRGTSQLRRTRLKPVSDKRRAADDAEGGYRDAVIEARTRAANYCEAESTVMEVACGGRLDPHHVARQGTGGPRADTDNIIMICRNHHDWIHAHTTTARERGLLQ